MNDSGAGAPGYLKTPKKKFGKNLVKVWDPPPPKVRITQTTQTNTNFFISLIQFGCVLALRCSLKQCTTLLHRLSWPLVFIQAYRYNAEPHCSM